MINEDIKFDFLEQFEFFSNAIAFYKDNKTQSFYPHHVNYGPKRILQLYKPGAIEYVLSPVYKNLTKMVWIDVDSHSTDSSIRAESLQIATLIFNNLIELKCTPELSESQIHSGNYHIVLWFELPQNKKFAFNALCNFIKSLNLSRAVEIGPQNGKLFRPWFITNTSKNKWIGRLITRGRRMKDLSSFLKFYAPEREENKPLTQEVVSTSFDIKNFIPDGKSLKRNAAILKLVFECKKNGCDDKTIMAYSEEIFKKGVVHDSLPVHLAETQRAMDGFKYKAGRSWTSFWSGLAKHLKPEQLILRVAEFARVNRFDDLMIPVHRVAQYYGISEPTAFRWLKKWQKDGLLVLRKRGNAATRIANRYGIGSSLKLSD